MASDLTTSIFRTSLISGRENISNRGARKIYPSECLVPPLTANNRLDSQLKAGDGTRKRGMPGNTCRACNMEVWMRGKRAVLPAPGDYGAVPAPGDYGADTASAHVVIMSTGGPTGVMPTERAR